MKTLLILLLLFPVQLFATITVIDDEGRQLTFEEPLRRIVSLSPHATELLFAAGATDQIIATVNYSDFPAAAKKIPRIGSYRKIDLEAIVALQPDLIIGWRGGGSDAEINKIQKLGYPIYFSEPLAFKDVARNIVNMGKFLGTEKIANRNANSFLAELAMLEEIYGNPKQKKINVFYQVWNKPLITINRDHMITQVIEFCGGQNVFGDLNARAPRVNLESVIQRSPDAIIIGMSKDREGWREEWNRWANIEAVNNNHVYEIDADLIVRQSPRIIQGTLAMCRHLEKVRKDLGSIKRDGSS